MRNEEGMRQLVQILSSCIGSTTNPKRISNTFKSVKNIGISHNTIKDYLGYLQDAFLIEEALRYDVKGRKYIGTESKYYFTDMGLRSSILDFRQLEENLIMENVIYNELRMRGYLVDVGMVETWKKNKEGQNVRSNLEIDFVGCSLATLGGHAISRLAIAHAVLAEDAVYRHLETDGLQVAVAFLELVTQLALQLAFW